MVPGHEIELLCIVLMALPPHILTNMTEQRSLSNAETRLWATIADIRQQNEFNKDFKTELNIVANAFSGCSTFCCELIEEEFALACCLGKSR